MKKPKLEDFGLTEEEYDVAARKQRVARLCEKYGRSSKLPLPMGRILVGSFCVTILIGVATAYFGKLGADESVAISVASFWILFIALNVYFEVKIEDQTRKEFSKPVYRKVKNYESALEQYQQTKERHWKSLRGARFEKSLALLYKKCGYAVSQTKSSGDEGIDLILIKEGAKTVVQCKGHAKPIGVGAARDLYGAMMHFGAENAVLACPAGFTNGVIQFVRDKPIQLISASELVDLTESVCQKG